MQCLHCKSILYVYASPLSINKTIYHICEHCFTKHPVILECERIVLNHCDVDILNIMIEEVLDNLTIMHYLSLLQHFSNHHLVLWFEYDDIDVLKALENIDIGKLFIFHLENKKERWHV